MPFGLENASPCHVCALWHEGPEGCCGVRLPHESDLYWRALKIQHMGSCVGDMVRARVRAQLEITERENELRKHLTKENA